MGSGLAHLGAHFGYLLRRALARIFQRMGKHRLHGKAGPVKPDRIDQIVFGNQADVFRLERSLDIGHGFDHHGGAVKPEARARCQGLGQPLVPGQHIGLAQIYDLNIRTR